MPPWTFPQDYCTGINPGMTDWQKTPTVLDGDTAFCLSWSFSLWHGFLFAGLAAWVFFTMLSIFGSFEWRDLVGFLTSEVLRRLGRQLGYLLAALSSFFLLLTAHQLIYLLLSLFLHDQNASGGLPSWHTDLLWNHSYLGAMIDARQAIDFDINHGGFANPNGGNDFPAPFGLTWDQVRGILDTLIGFVPEAVSGVRFATMFVALVTAPLAIICKSNPLTSPIFDLWWRYWLQLEGIAIGSIAVLAAYHSMDLSHLSATNADYVRLAMLGLVTVANLAFVSAVLGNFLREGAQYYASQQQRANASGHGWLGAVAVGLGVLVTAALAIPTGGLDLPAALAVGGAVTGAVGGGGGAILTANQAQSTPGAQVGPGPQISSGFTRAALGVSHAATALEQAGTPAWEAPQWQQTATGGLSAAPPDATRGELNQGYAQALNGLQQSLTPLSGVAPLVGFNPKSGLSSANVDPGQAAAAYAAAVGARAGIGLAPGASAIETWRPPAGTGFGPPGDYLRVQGQMVPVHSIETMLSRNAPWLRDAFLAHSQARLAPHYLPAVVAKVGNYYTRAGRNGYYDPTRVSQAVRQAVGSNAIGLHRGLISNTTVINRVLTALDKLK